MIVTDLLSPCFITLALVAVLIALVYYQLTRYHGYWETRGVPCEKPLIFFGNLWEVFSGQRPIGKHLGHLYSKFDAPYFGIYILGRPYLVLRSPEIIKNVTVRDFRDFEDRTFARVEDADPMAANSLFILKNPEWRTIRSKLTPIFTSGKLKLMFPLMRECGKNLDGFLANNEDKVLDMKEVAARFMTNLVVSCFFGIDANSIGDESCRFRQATKKMFDADVYTSFRFFAYFFVPQLVSFFKMPLLDTSFLKSVFLNTLKDRKETGIERNDLVDLLLSVKDQFDGTDCKFDDEMMVAQAVTFFIAGFETTSTAVAFGLYELCIKQECQDKLRQEIHDTFAENEEISFDKIQQMKYLDMVLSETLRRYPFGPFLNRQCTKEYVVPQTGLKIEKGTPVLVPIDGLHFDPIYYPDPENFKPERFQDGNRHMTSSFVYLPFGVGPRNCIGDRFGQISAKVGLVSLLRRFKVTPCKETPIPMVLNPKSPFVTPIRGLKMMVSGVHKL